MNMNKSIVLTSIIFICLGIILGAFAAHSLEKTLNQNGIAIFETGVRYQLYMGLGLLPIGLLADRFSFQLKLFQYLAVTGVIIFSGCLYILAFKEFHGLKFFGGIVPIGGTLMIASWIVLFVKILRSK